MTRTMQAQMAYHGGLSKAGWPEEQFVKVLYVHDEARAMARH